jgi:hypothetical protein
MSPKRAMPKGTVRQWRVTELRAKGQHLGIVEAVDAETAIKLAIERFGITDPERQRRLIAHQIGE